MWLIKNFLKPGSFGLDISDFSLKLIQLKKEDKHLTLASFGQKEIPPGIIEKTEIMQEETLAKLISNLIEQVQGEPIKTKYLVASLPEEKAFVRVVQLPMMSKEEVAQAIQWEVEANIPLPIEQVYFDWQIIPPFKNRVKVKNYQKQTNVLVMAMSKKTVDSYLKVLKQAGLQPLALEVESIALVRTCIKNIQSPYPVLILDMGSTGTGLTIFSGQTIVFTSHIPVSGQDLNQAIANHLKVNLEEAKQLKIEVGLDREREGGKVAQALEPIIDKFIQQIKHYVNFYLEHGQISYTPDGIVAKILLCGGDSLLIGLPAALSLKLKIQTELANPWINILKPPLKEVPNLPYQKSLAYSTALGLALRSFANAQS